MPINKSVATYEKPIEDLTLEEAVQLTAQCGEVGEDWRAPPERRWKALLWSNRRGEPVAGFGPSALEAVLAAHRRAA